MTKVFLLEERILGELITAGAHVSLIRYNLDGTQFEEYIENDEFEVIDA